MYIEAFIQEVYRVMTLAEELYGVDMSEVDVLATLKSDCSAGRAGYMFNRTTQERFSFYVNFNPIAIRDCFETMFSEAIPHEIAHTVCQMRPDLGNDHDAGWKRVCIALGGTGGRCMSDTWEKIRKKNVYTYRVSNGDELEISAVRHSKIQKGKVYLYRGMRLDKTMLVN